MTEQKSEIPIYSTLTESTPICFAIPEIAKYRCCLQLGDTKHIVSVFDCKIFQYLMKNMIDTKLEYKEDEDEFKYVVKLNNDFFMEDLKTTINIGSLWSMAKTDAAHILRELKFLDISKLFRVMEIMTYLEAPEELQNILISDFVGRATDEKQLSELIV